PPVTGPAPVWSAAASACSACSSRRSASGESTTARMSPAATSSPGSTRNSASVPSATAVSVVAAVASTVAGASTTSTTSPRPTSSRTASPDSSPQDTAVRLNMTATPAALHTSPRRTRSCYSVDLGPGVVNGNYGPDCADLAPIGIGHVLWRRLGGQTPGEVCHAHRTVSDKPGAAGSVVARLDRAGAGSPGGSRHPGTHRRRADGSGRLADR